MGIREQRKWQFLKRCLGLLLLIVVAVSIVVKLNPMIFNESFFGHAHCIKQADGALRMYAGEHHGSYPTHTNGFGDALLPLALENGPAIFAGPMFDSVEFLNAGVDGRNVDEGKLGRIYVQGLTRSSNPNIAIMFDQLATPGGDHAHFHHRLLAPYLREILEIGNGVQLVEEADWHSYATNQVEMLVAEGIDRETAQGYYEMTDLKFDLKVGAP